MADPVDLVHADRAEYLDLLNEFPPAAAAGADGGRRGTGIFRGGAADAQTRPGLFRTPPPSKTIRRPISKFSSR